MKSFSAGLLFSVAGDKIRPVVKKTATIVFFIVHREVFIDIWRQNCKMTGFMCNGFGRAN
jgi:hypothetical protein